MTNKSIEGILIVKSKKKLRLNDFVFFGTKKLYVIIGKINSLRDLVESNKDKIISFVIEEKANNPRYNLFSYANSKARIEYGAIIRENVSIDDRAIILMGAVVNTGAKIGEDTMIDMGAIIGSGAQIGKRVHVGANAVISGVLEPKSSKEVVIEDDAFIGANAVILEGIRIGEGAIIGAGAIVTKDVPKGSVVVGNPGKEIKNRSEVTKNVSINHELRK